MTILCDACKATGLRHPAACCPKCGKRGTRPTRPTKCRYCRGEGAVMCNFGHDHACPNCSGRGNFYEPVTYAGPEVAEGEDCDLCALFPPLECAACKGAGVLQPNGKPLARLAP